MSATTDRLKALVDEHLDLAHPVDFDAKFSDSGVSSVDAVAFVKAVNQEFGLTVPPEDVAKMQTLNDVAGYLDTHAG